MSFLKIAFSQLGEVEIPGAEHNSTIVQYARETGIGGITTDEIAWCSTFINWCAMKAGLSYTKKANARSWLSIGKVVTAPKPGDVVVFWRESIHSWKGHVGIFLGYNENLTQVFCLGGNQSNAVSISQYDKNKVLGFRRLEEIEAVELAKPELKRNDRGDEVVKLQQCLNFLQYNCGDADGIFGSKTESALRLLQSNKHLTIDGIYNDNTANAMESMLQS